MATRLPPVDVFVRAASHIDPFDDDDAIERGRLRPAYDEARLIAMITVNDGCRFELGIAIAIRSAFYKVLFFYITGIRKLDRTRAVDGIKSPTPSLIRRNRTAYCGRGYLRDSLYRE